MSTQAPLDTKQDQVDAIFKKLKASAVDYKRAHDTASVISHSTSHRDTAIKTAIAHIVENGLDLTGQDSATIAEFVSAELMDMSQRSHVGAVKGNGNGGPKGFQR